MLGAIGGGALGFFTGGPAGAVALGAKGFQTGNAMDAESSAAKQSQAGYDKGAAVLSPYNSRGNSAGDTLAGYLGIDVPDGGFGGPMGTGQRLTASGQPMPTSLEEFYARPGRQLGERTAKSNTTQTLGNFLDYAGLDPSADDQQIQPMPQRMKPSGSRTSSSYATREAV